MNNKFLRCAVFTCAGLLCLVVAACQKPEEIPPPQPVINGERIAFPKDGKQTALLKSAPVDASSATAATVPGRLAWNEDRTSRIFSPVGGRVVALPAVPGQAVKAGQTLAGISSPDFGQAQAEVRRAETDLALAQKSLSRAQELHTAGVIPEKDVHAALADQARAQAERDRTLAREKLYGKSSGSAVDQQFRLTSPIAGIIVERNLNPGQEVRPDQAQPGNPPLFVVTDPALLWAQLELPESLLGAVKAGMAIVLRAGAFPDEKFPARIEFVADAIDPASRTVKARASVANPGRRLKSEMFVSAELALPPEVAPKVQASAVLLIGDKQYVFVDLGDFSYERRPVTADEMRLGLMRLRSGVKSGEKVVVEGALLLQQLLAARTQQ
jgi:cobalt-zinc-cadmium efflux system membrane fusion protein